MNTIRCIRSSDHAEKKNRRQQGKKVASEVFERYYLALFFSFIGNNLVHTIVLHASVPPDAVWFERLNSTTKNLTLL